MPHRYFTSSPIVQGESVTLEKEEMKHLKNVMRTKPGTPIEIVNGEGILGKALFNDPIIVDTVEKSSLTSHRSLALALTEPKILNLVLEKATELGITTFYIFAAQKSKLSTLSDSKKERAQKILISAMKQSKRLFLPKIIYLNKKEELPKDANYLLADFDGEQVSKAISANTFIIGPESGFTKEEISFFKEKLKAASVLLSDGILRAETAAICAASLM